MNSEGNFSGKTQSKTGKRTQESGIAMIHVLSDTNMPTHSIHPISVYGRMDLEMYFLNKKRLRNGLLIPECLISVETSNDRGLQIPVINCSDQDVFLPESSGITMFEFIEGEFEFSYIMFQFYGRNKGQHKGL